MSIRSINGSLSAWRRLHAKRAIRIRHGLIGTIGFIALLHIAGWGTLLGIVAPQHLGIGVTAFGLGIGLTAYTLGMRHAFDADHIAAIDNTIRKLMQDGKRPASVGFWFSFGHSSIVFGLTLLLCFGIRAVAKPVLDNNSELHQVTSLIGTIVSSGFLYAIAAINVVVLVDVCKVFRQMRTGTYNESALESRLENRGMMNILLRRVMRLVSQPWQMYFVGLLFGLGFDTATEIALLVLTGSGAASGLPWYAILCLPILFASGMALFDTVDGSFMTIAYGWALTKPVRKIYYNLVITSLSVAVALIIGTIEIVASLSAGLDLHGAVWSWIGSVNLNNVGFIIVGLFVATWALAIAIWKWGRIEERWTYAGSTQMPESD